MTWVKGTSGNPGGRPRIAGEVRDLAQANCLAAIERLVLAMDSVDPRVSMAAAKEILDRGVGKAVQCAAVNDADVVVATEISRIELARRIAWLFSEELASRGIEADDISEGETV